MAKQIFRQAALDRLASPEKLDAPTRLVGAPGWTILLAFVAAIGFGAYWALTTKAPVSVEAEGILIDRAGLVEISADLGGRLELVDLTPNTVVQQGQVVGRISQAELRRDLDAATARHEDAKERYQRFEAFHDEQRAREKTADDARRGTVGRTLAVLRERADLLEERVRTTQQLVDRKVVIQDRLLDAQIEATSARERISELEEEALRLDLDAVERESERRISLLDESLEVEEQEREVARLTARLNDSQEIRSAHMGRVVEVKVNPGDVIQPGDALATLAPPDGTGELEAVFYAEPAQGKRIEAGMEAEVAPSAVEREVY
ncbi:MAG: NHLP bacteriocin system secretion protein, partial [Pseudomonadota bacterium]